MHHNLEELVKQWDRLCSTAVGAGQKYADIDSLHWFNYLAFDIIGDLVRPRIVLVMAVEPTTG